MEFSSKRASATKNWPLNELLPPVVAVILVFLASLHPQPDLLFEEPAGTAHLPAYAGLFSYLGAALWIGPGSIAVFVGRFNPALAQLGWFSIYLGLDDLLMIHDRWLPRLIPSYLVEAQPFLFLVYALVLAHLLHANRPLFAAKEASLLVLALTLLGGSALLDALAEWGIFSAPVILEDGLKFVGLVPWASCLTSLSRKLLPSE